jgi:hypothetical protein
VHRIFGNARGLSLLATALLLMAAGACDGPLHMEPGGISLVSGALQTDTVEAFLAQPLVVEVRDPTGSRMPGVTVRFSADSATLGAVEQPAVSLSTTTPDDYEREVEAVTDATGRAAVRVRLGHVLGTAGIVITVPALGSAAYAEFVIVPGAAVRMTVLPSDTSVYVGGSYALRITTEDRFGHAGSRITAASDAPAVATATTSVTGHATGRTRVVMKAGQLQVPIFVSVVPQGTMAVVADGIHAVGLDGSGYRRMVQEGPGGAPGWFPDGLRLVFTRRGRTWISGPDGVAQPLVQGTNPLAAEARPRPSRNGEWVYFDGYDADNHSSPYRVRADGTGLQLLPGFTPDARYAGRTTPSPAGDRVVYTQQTASGLTLRIMDLQTGQLVAQDIPGYEAAWSHGDSIAYLDPAGVLRMMSSAGQGHRAVVDGIRYVGGFDWSPDDQWIALRADATDSTLEIVRVATGERIPVPAVGRIFGLAWRP